MKPPTAAVTLTYSIGRSLYLPLTCRCNSFTLPQTRGPGFFLPDDVVGSLLEVRRLEGFPQADGGADSSLACTATSAIPDLAADGSKGGRRPLPSPSSWPPVDVLPAPQSPPTPDDAKGYPIEAEFHEDGRAPTVRAIVTEALTLLERRRYDSVVIAGEGEPTLRLRALLSVVRGLRSRSDVCPKSIRVATNGLCGADRVLPPDEDVKARGSGGGIIRRSLSVPYKMKEAGITGLTIAIMTACPAQYDELMGPRLSPNIDAGIESAHAVVQSFIKDAIATGLEVEVTGVDRPGVEKAGTEVLAAELGVTMPFRWRPYFP